MSANSPTPQKPLGPPLIGALLRIPLEVVTDRMLARLNEHGFSDLVLAHLVILRYPGPNGRRPGEIAAGSGLSKQAANYLIGQLERLGYVERHGDPDDLRAKRVFTTPRGWEAARVIRAAVTEVEQEWANDLGDDKLEHLRELLIELSGAVAANRS